MRRFLMLLILFAVVAFAATPFAVPLLLENKIRTEFSRATGSQLSFGWALFNPFSLSLTIRNLEIKNTVGDRLIFLRSAKFDFEWFNVWSGSGALKSDGLEAQWKRYDDRTLIALDHLSLDIFQGLQTVSDYQVKSGLADGSIALITGGDIVVDANLQVRDLALQGPPGLPSARVKTARIYGLSYGRRLNQITVNSLSLDHPQINVVRTKETSAYSATSVIEPINKYGAEALSLLLPEVNVENGTVTFADKKRSGEPVKFTELAGRFTNLTLGESISSTFDLTAIIAGESQLELAGQFRHDEALNGEVRSRLDKLSYQHLTPYTFYLLGRGVDAGTAYMDMDISVADDLLDGKVSLVFDQWKWGARNPDFVGDQLPVRKAFNLLEGKGGRVRMTLPIEGNLADPTFKVDAVVRRATRRALGDIVGAPFKLLGSLIPGGKKDLDLDKIEFAASSADLTPLDRSKLNALADAMKLRPQLKLRIDAIAIPAVDLPDPSHVSDSSISEEERLQILANRRAQVVLSLLVAAGVDVGRLSIVIVPVAEAEKRKKPVVRLEISE